MRFLILFLISFAMPVMADDLTAQDGWAVQTTDKPYVQLLGDTKAAVKANKMGVVTEAGPTGTAKKRGITIPGNRVIGVFNNVFAVDMLKLSTAAMIEAPIRMYVTENDDGTATLSYKTPSHVLAPYDGGEELKTMAAELDTIFAKIAADAIK
ncbi:DUF302 domain-containing protein [Pseudosulfitobacter sp. SM2401]|uniref:DUF302 domain-containing protein n=1 Tax=Pseudosulfitobacter sp. SM2401 TaxID=3350098 RepID=UPI0036F3EACC